MDRFEILSKVIETSNASVDVDRRVENLIQLVASVFRFPLVTLFLWNARQETLDLRYINAPHPSFPPGLSLSVQDGPLGACVLQKTPVIIPDTHRIPQISSSPKNFYSQFRFIACFPLIDDIFLYGVLAACAEEVRHLSDQESQLLSVICRQLAGTIRNAQISVQGKKRIAELSTLHAIGASISSTLELGELLNRITLSSTKVLQAEGSLLHLLDEEGGALKVVSSFGLEESEASRAPLQFGDEIAEIVARTAEPVLIRDVRTSAFSSSHLVPNLSSIVCVPLVFKSRTIGTLTLFSLREEGRQEKIFDEEDKNLLCTMASQIAMAIENAIILQRAEFLTRDKERMVRELSLLYEVSRSMLTTIRLDQLARIILLGITLKHPEGFDRAALFLVNEKDNLLEGILGIGASSLQEANAWRQQLDEKLFFFPEWEIPLEIEKTDYDRKIRQIQIPLTRADSIMVKAIRQKHSFNVERDDVALPGSPEIFRDLDCQAFAVIPLIAKEKAIGALVVDNQLTGRHITPTNIGFLTLLANQAALAIENSRLYRNLQEINTQLLQTQNRLIQSEKLAALGEMVAAITHEIKNPLTSIGGFARRLSRSFSNESPEKKYMNIILKEVQRLEDFLNETLTYSRGSIHLSGPHELHRILEETLLILEGQLQEKRIRLRKDFMAGLPSLYCDPAQVKQVFMNIIINAIQAMGEEGTLSIRTSRMRKNEQPYIEVEIEDTGGGIGIDILDNIFNPFFTTKAEGTGLGLAIAHKIVTQHQGEIEVTNHPGSGATFQIRFPLRSPENR